MTGEDSTFLEGNIIFVCSVSFALHTGLKTRVQWKGQTLLINIFV